MIAYRLFAAHRQPDDATGALLRGGRWNSPGVPLLYAASSLSLACLELLVHIRDPRNLPPYAYSSIEFAETKLLRWNESELRGDALMESLILSREEGDAFIEFRESNRENLVQAREAEHPWEESMIKHVQGNLERCVKQVPSAVIREEWNYLVDPDTTGQLKWSESQPFRFDPRLLDAQSR